MPLNPPEIVFASDVIAKVLFGSVGAAGAMVAAGSFLSPKIAARILPKPKESRLADFLPFERILPDGMTVLCKGSLCQFVGVAGIDQTFMEEGEAESYTHTRKAVYDALSEGNVTLRIFTLRDPIILDTKAHYATDLAGEVARNWNKQFKDAFRTRTIIAMTRKGTAQQDAERLNELRSTLESLLANFQAAPITQDPGTSPWKDTTIGSFLGRLISPISCPSPRGKGGENFSDMLVADEVHFLRNGRMRFRAGSREKYAVAIGIKRFGDDISSVMTNYLASLPHEMVLFQNVTPMSKTSSIARLKQNQLMMRASSFGAGTINAQYQEAIERVEGMDEGRSTLCFFSQTVFLFGNTLEEVDEAERACRQIFNSNGITAATERGATQASWFNQFPSYEDRPRQYRLMSDNVAMAATFDNPPSGNDRSDWGPGPIAYFHTGSNTTYSHQFHATPDAGAVGHGLCIAPTGAGKTVLMEFLSCMASRHSRVRHFFFDRYQGTYIYTTAMGGRYLGFNGTERPRSIRGGMNPFQCEDTQSNREFLKNWLMGLTGAPEDSDEATNLTSDAVDAAFDLLPFDKRSLANVYAGALPSGSETHKALRKWVDPALYGTMFNAPEDCIDLDDNWLTTFDMTNLFSDHQLAGASVSYIMHRIRQTMQRNQAPGFIFIDETEPLLRDPQFRKIYFIMLQEFRKLGGVVISVFQRPEALKASQVSELVLQQASTYYLFPNPAASASQYDEFQLTEREMNFVLGHTRPARATSRTVLVKRPQTRESVILDINLSHLGPLLKVFSSNSRDVDLVAKLQQQFGDRWVQRYIDDSAP